MDTSVQEFPNFKKWFEDVSNEKWPKIKNIGISKYYRFIMKLKIKNNKQMINVSAYKYTFTEDEATNFWTDDFYSTYRNYVKKLIPNKKQELEKYEKECMLVLSHLIFIS